MNFKPANFFIGLLDFFSIILPGIILCYLQLPFLNSITNDFFKDLLDNTQCIVGLLIASYVAGHFVYALGSLLDHYAYEFFRKKVYPPLTDKAYLPATEIKKK